MLHTASHESIQKSTWGGTRVKHGRRSGVTPEQRNHMPGAVWSSSLLDAELKSGNRAAACYRNLLYPENSVTKYWNIELVNDKNLKALIPRFIELHGPTLDLISLQHFLPDFGLKLSRYISTSWMY